MEREDEGQFEAATVQEELVAEESRGSAIQVQRIRSDGEALALHEI
jgi:hypothetical protein